MLYQYYPVGGERLQPIFANLNNWGFQDWLLPFLLLFALMFAVLQKVQIFSKQKLNNEGKPEGDKRVGNTKINGLLSFLISLMVVIPHVLRMYPQSKDPVIIFHEIFPSAAILSIVLVLALLVLGLSAPTPGKSSTVVLLLGLLAVITICVVALKAIFPAIVPDWLWLDPNTQAVIVVIGVTALVIWFVAGEESKTDIHKSLPKWLGELPKDK